tara:strand:- start:328 stop:774 length:447 start_codon:yes stop_codon:yes gene_type:complete
MMVLTSPTFRIEILPNALAALPELFEGLDSVLPALHVQLEEVWSGLEGAPTEILITANVEQAILDSRSVFLVHPKPDPAMLSNLLDTGRSVRWIPENTDQGTWVDAFARFVHTLRLAERVQCMTHPKRARAERRLQDSLSKGRRKRAS